MLARMALPVLLISMYVALALADSSSIPPQSPPAADHDSRTLFVILTVLATSLGTLLLQEFIKSVFKRLEDWAFGRVARLVTHSSWSTRGIARRMREVQVRLYGTYPMAVIQKPIDIRKIFVPVRLRGHNNTSFSISRPAERLIDESLNVVVLGPPGAGKSMLMRHLVLALPERGAFGEVIVPLLVSLHEWDSTREGFEEFLLRQLAASASPSRALRVLDTQRVVFLLDGLDEVRAPLRTLINNTVSKLMQDYPRSRVVVSCRDAVYRGEWNAGYNVQVWDIVPFDERQRTRFVENLEQEFPADRTADMLVEGLQRHPAISLITTNPLMLSILVLLFRGNEFAWPESRARFFTAIDSEMLEKRASHANEFTAHIKRVSLGALAFAMQQQGGESRKSISATSALTVLSDATRHIRADIDASLLLQELIDRTGMLSEVGPRRDIGFSHLAFQEFYAALALASKKQDPLQFYRTCPDDWREVVVLWCGLVDSCAAIEDGSLDPVFALECLGEARSPNSQTLNSLLSAVMPQLGHPASTARVERVLGTLAARVDESVVDLAMTSILGVLDSPGVLARQQAAARAIAYSRSPRAASELAARYDRGDYIAEALVKMGDAAVDELERLVRSGVHECVARLASTSTPRALRALAELTRDHNTVVRRTSSAQLGARILDYQGRWLRGQTARSRNDISPDLDWSVPYLPKELEHARRLVSRIAMTIGRDCSGSDFQHIDRPQHPLVAVAAFLQTHRDWDSTRMHDICSAIHSSFGPPAMPDGPGYFGRDFSPDHASDDLQRALLQLPLEPAFGIRGALVLQHMDARIASPLATIAANAAINGHFEIEIEWPAAFHEVQAWRRRLNRSIVFAVSSIWLSSLFVATIVVLRSDDISRHAIPAQVSVATIASLLIVLALLRTGTRVRYVWGVVIGGPCSTAFRGLDASLTSRLVAGAVLGLWWLSCFATLDAALYHVLGAECPRGWAVVVMLFLSAVWFAMTRDAHLEASPLRRLARMVRGALAVSREEVAA